MATTRKPATPVDLDLDALEKEAINSDGGTPEPFTFRIHGHTLSMAVAENSDFRVLDYLARNDIPAAIRLLLGEEQYEKFTAKPVSMRTLKTLINGWYAAKGTSTGE